MVRKVVGENAAQVKEYISGKQKVYGFFVGQIMKLSQGKMNPDLVNKVLKEELDACAKSGS